MIAQFICVLQATDKTVSVSSIDSGDVSRVKEDGKGTEAADAWEAGMTLEAGMSFMNIHVLKIKNGRL